jgi:hypothetical protein
VNFFDMNKEGCDLRAEEELIVASFTRRLIKISAVSGARGSGSSPTAAFNAMRLPAIALDQKGNCCRRERRGRSRFRQQYQD